MDRKKILLLIPSISDYRVETYNMINKEFELTVAYNYKDNTKSECEFKKEKLPTTKWGNFWINKLSFFKYCRSFDVVIFAADVHSPFFCLLPFIYKMVPVIPWTIGTRASYKRKYDLNRKKTLRDYVTFLILKKSDAIVFYMDQAITYWKDFSLDKNKIFIAHNTTKVLTNINCQKKSQLIFVGTLYKEKGLDVLLNNYYKAYCYLGNDIPSLILIGGGDEYDYVKQYTEKHFLGNKISLLGPIYEEKLLSAYFASSLACISPNQAGLSVLKSMGYGVPFVTKRDAVTGGEIFNIENGVTGVLYDNDDDLYDLIVDITENPSRYIEMGEKAKQFYNLNATPQIMADGVIKAINYVLSHKK